jgi:hypothetical protein
LYKPLFSNNNEQEDKFYEYFKLDDSDPLLFQQKKRELTKINKEEIGEKYLTFVPSKSALSISLLFCLILLLPLSLVKSCCFFFMCFFV